VFFVRRRRRGDEQKLQPRPVVGFDPPFGSGRHDDDVTRFDRAFGPALPDRSGPRLDVDHEVAGRGVDGNELSRLEVPTDDLHPVAFEDRARRESLVVVGPFGVEIRHWHGSASVET
jgi:hypothetical protein